MEKVRESTEFIEEPLSDEQVDDNLEYKDNV